jgi:ankyrin repeat protein
LFDAGAAVDTRDNRGETPLHWAIQGGHKQIVEWLLDHGADIHARDIEGHTPLHTAVIRFGGSGIDKKALVELLLRRGANLTATYLQFSPMGLFEISPKFITTFVVKDNSVLEVLARYEKQQKKV